MEYIVIPDTARLFVITVPKADEIIDILMRKGWIAQRWPYERISKKENQSALRIMIIPPRERILLRSAWTRENRFCGLPPLHYGA